MERDEVAVLKQPNQVSLGGLLQGPERLRLEPEIGLEARGDLTAEPRKRQLPNQNFRRLLEPTDLPKRDRARAVPVRLLDTACSRRRLAGRLRGKLLAWRLAAGGLACSLLRARHRRSGRMWKWTGSGSRRVDAILTL